MDPAPFRGRGHPSHERPNPRGYRGQRAAFHNHNRHGFHPQHYEDAQLDTTNSWIESNHWQNAMPNWHPYPDHHHQYEERYPTNSQGDPHFSTHGPYRGGRGNSYNFNHSHRPARSYDFPQRPFFAERDLHLLSQGNAPGEGSGNHQQQRKPFMTSRGAGSTSRGGGGAGGGRGSVGPAPRKPLPLKRDLPVAARCSFWTTETQNSARNVDKAHETTPSAETVAVVNKVKETLKMLKASAIPAGSTQLAITAGPSHCHQRDSAAGSNDVSRAMDPENLLDGLGFIDNRAVGGAAGERAPAEVTVPTNGDNSREHIDGIVALPPERVRTGRPSLTKEQVLQNILAMDNNQRRHLVDQPPSCMSNVLEELVRDSVSAQARQLSTRRFRINADEHSLYNDLESALDNSHQHTPTIAAEESELVEQVGRIFNEEATTTNNDDEIEVLETPSKPQPLCIDLEDCDTCQVYLDADDLLPGSPLSFSDNGHSTESDHTARLTKSCNSVSDFTSDLEEDGTSQVQSPAGATLFDETAKFDVASLPSDHLQPVIPPPTPDPSCANTSIASPVPSPAPDSQSNADAGSPSVRDSPSADRDAPCAAQPPARELPAHSNVLMDLIREEKGLYDQVNGVDYEIEELTKKRKLLTARIMDCKRQQLEHMQSLLSVAPTPPTSTQSAAAAAAATTSVKESGNVAIGTAQLAAPVASAVTVSPQTRLAQQLGRHGVQVDLGTDVLTFNLDAETEHLSDVESTPQLENNKRKRSLVVDSPPAPAKKNPPAVLPSPSPSASQVQKLPAQQSDADGGGGETLIAGCSSSSSSSNIFTSLEPHKASVKQGAMLVKGPALFTAALDKIVHVYDLVTGDLVMRILGHPEAVTCLQSQTTSSLSKQQLDTIVNTGDYLEHINLITGSSDGYVRQFSLATGDLTSEVSCQHPVTCMVPSKYQGSLLIGSTRGFIYIYNAKQNSLKVANFQVGSFQLRFDISGFYGYNIIRISDFAFANTKQIKCQYYGIFTEF